MLGELISTLYLTHNVLTSSQQQRRPSSPGRNRRHARLLVPREETLSQDCWFGRHCLCPNGESGQEMGRKQEVARSIDEEVGRCQESEAAGVGEAWESGVKSWVVS